MASEKLRFCCVYFGAGMNLWGSSHTLGNSKSKRLCVPGVVLSMWGELPTWRLQSGAAHQIPTALCGFLSCLSPDVSTAALYSDYPVCMGFLLQWPDCLLESYSPFRLRKAFPTGVRWGIGSSILSFRNSKKNLWFSLQVAALLMWTVWVVLEGT